MRKAEYIDKIVDIVVDCCATQIDDTGRTTFTKDQLLSNCRTENVVLTRSILVVLILAEGYTVSTCADLLRITPHQVRNLRTKAQDTLITSRAFRLAFKDAVNKVEELRSHIGL